MNTYKIVGHTNGWIASRDIHFNGKTSVDFATGLTLEEAQDKLIEWAEKDYDNYYTVVVDSKEDLAKETMLGSMHQHYYEALEEDFDENEMWASVAKRWTRYGELQEAFKWDGPGLYVDGRLLIAKGGMSYEHDSRYYSIVEETEDE